MSAHYVAECADNSRHVRRGENMLLRLGGPELLDAAIAHNRDHGHAVKCYRYESDAEIPVLDMPAVQA